ncbi:hypothetical protein ACQUQU_15940 [Thalassolituus sp. LLYu03]|uniref:hypothetical protein n=1 Tax=Thalassolituus sp. LLYu03 TaxID=3421656 RepID=UPI003D267C6F
MASRWPSLLAALTSLLVLSGCTVKPVYRDVHYQNCEMSWRKVELRSEGLFDSGSGRVNCGSDAHCQAAFLVVSGLISAGSALVSGSVYVVGNTMHWLEYQGRCPESTLNQAMTAFSDDGQEPGGDEAQELSSDATEPGSDEYQEPNGENTDARTAPSAKRF